MDAVKAACASERLDVKTSSRLLRIMGSDGGFCRWSPWTRKTQSGNEACRKMV